jgi:hypothetical protein
VHDWYRIVLGYSDHLVASLLDRFGVTANDKDHIVLDPFCGTGTTLVESMKRQVQAVGIDANPSSAFAARVKTTWSVDPGRLSDELRKVQAAYQELIARRAPWRSDVTAVYLTNAGLVERGWISPKPLRKAIAIKQAIRNQVDDGVYQDALMLALAAETVSGSSNVKFGPELYCGTPKLDADVVGGFSSRVHEIVRDLSLIHEMRLVTPQARVREGDARAPADVGRAASAGRFTAVICSPPYPTEHDYTRNARLELAMLEFVTDRTTLRVHKKQMIRSHTKGVYVRDDDNQFVAGNTKIEALTAEIDERVEGKSDGFSQLYSTVVREYFGGMKRHLLALRSQLAPGAQCAYVVGDQSSYSRVHIPTAEILGDLAEECGYEVTGIEEWRTRWATTTSKLIRENILFLRYRVRRG